MRLALAVITLSSFAACSDHQHGDDDETYNCDRETRDDEFVLGIEKAGTAGQLMFEIVNATPSPPMRGDNTWEVQVTAMAGGAALTGGQLQIEGNMPDHQHGPPYPAIATEMGNGMYEISPINMWMPGLWETTIRASAGATTDSAVFKFCIPN